MILSKYKEMGCSGCSSGSNSGKPNGCNSNGGCSTGGCNRLNTYDWLSNRNFYDPTAFNIVEVSFKNGSRKSFFWNESDVNAETGDFVIVETGSGIDVGIISLSGDLVRLQMKKKRFKEDRVMYKIIRRAAERDMEKMEQARSKEKQAMIRARVISRNLDLEMKIGDVEYQADLRKATFYYTAEGRIDFRELVRQYAKEFRVKIEMRQIGSRQESGMIGGIGSCGRELCCSTWLTDFKSVNTSAARYQNLAINQSKLSGQCGRLKCCLNYELDTYLDALEDFPKKADVLYTKAGKAILVKTDIFKRLMFYCYEIKGRRGHVMPVAVEDVKEILSLNAKNEQPEELTITETLLKTEGDTNAEMVDITGEFEMHELSRSIDKNSRKRRSRNYRRKKTNKGGKSRSYNKGDSNSQSRSSDAKPKMDNTPASKEGKGKNPSEQGNRKWNKSKNQQNKIKKD